MTTTWLPHPHLKEHRETFIKLSAVKHGSRRLRLSEFLQPETILFFAQEEDPRSIADALLKTMRGCDPMAARHAVWRREEDLPIRLSSDITILRGRLETLHHLQAAIAISPESKAPVTVLFLGPVNQNRLHAGLLVAISSLFSRPGIARKIARSKTAKELLGTLRAMELQDSPAWPVRRFFKTAWEFFRLYYTGILPTEESF